MKMTFNTLTREALEDALRQANDVMIADGYRIGRYRAVAEAAKEMHNYNAGVAYAGKVACALRLEAALAEISKFDKAGIFAMDNSAKLELATALLAEVSENWNETEVANYPNYLPSFDELVSGLNAIEFQPVATPTLVKFNDGLEVVISESNSDPKTGFRNHRISIRKGKNGWGWDCCDSDAFGYVHCLTGVPEVKQWLESESKSHIASRQVVLAAKFAIEQLQLNPELL